jgi:hypothetical protein
VEDKINIYTQLHLQLGSYKHTHINTHTHTHTHTHTKPRAHTRRDGAHLGEWLRSQHERQAPEDEVGR